MKHIRISLMMSGSMLAALGQLEHAAAIPYLARSRLGQGSKLPFISAAKFCRQSRSPRWKAPGRA